MACDAKGRHVFKIERCERLAVRTLVAVWLAMWVPAMPNHYPEGPKIEKIQDFAPGLKFSRDQSQIELFNRDWTFQSRLKIRLPLWGIIKVGIEIFKRDWKFQSRLKFSILDWKFQSYGLKISRDQSGLNFFNRRALWVVMWVERCEPLSSIQKHLNLEVFTLHPVAWLDPTLKPYGKNKPCTELRSWAPTFPKS